MLGDTMRMQVADMKIANLSDMNSAEAQARRRLKFAAYEEDWGFDEPTLVDKWFY